jgi:hypothetical protein
LLNESISTDKYILDKEIVLIILDNKIKVEVDLSSLFAFDKDSARIKISSP